MSYELKEVSPVLPGRRDTGRDRNVKADHRSKSGFTLLELLVSFTILGIIIATVYSSLRVGINAWEASKRKVDTLQEARIALMRMTSRINGIYRPERGSKVIPLETENSFSLDHPEDRLKIVAFAYAFPHDRHPRGGLSEMTFYLEKGQGKKPGKIILLEKRGYSKEEDAGLPKRDDEGVIVTEIAYGAVGLNFRYFDGEEWKDEWDYEKEEGLPRAIEAAITLTAGEEPQTFSTAAEIPFLTGEEEKHVPMEERGME
jgi:type II secretion system protein J